MKKEYLTPEIEISVFATEDIITASTADDSSTTAGLTKAGALNDNATDGVPYSDIF